MTRPKVAAAAYHHFSGVFACLAILLIMPLSCHAQSDCQKAHSQPGAFICYPSPSEHEGARILSVIFHLSAQANSLPGHKITRYVVYLDENRVYEIKLGAPVERLAIETNIRSPFNSGVHTLRLAVDGAGSTVVSGLPFGSKPGPGLCDPFSRVDPRNCLLWRTRGVLSWSVTGTGAPGTSPFALFEQYADGYAQNLKSIEADTADAVAIDGRGNLYAAYHSFSDVELRKYGRDGSVLFDGLIRSCGTGFLTIAAIAVNASGRAWLAGTTTACITPSSNAAQKHAIEPGQPHGFVMLIDTTKLASAAPEYHTFLFPEENRVNALRVDADGNAYVVGTTEVTPQRAHDFTTTLDIGSQQIPGKRSGFICELNASGSSIRWSALLPGVPLFALAIDSAGVVHVTGRVERGGETSSAAREIAVASVSENGKRLSYLGRFRGAGNQEGRAISISAGGWLVIAGQMDSMAFLNESRAGSHIEPERMFALALRPCRQGPIYGPSLMTGQLESVPQIAVQPALDAFARMLVGVNELEIRSNRPKPMHAEVHTRNSCGSRVQ